VLVRVLVIVIELDLLGSIAVHPKEGVPANPHKSSGIKRANKKSYRTSRGFDVFAAWASCKMRTITRAGG
jgi:hypothetical protein